jgi:Family of unknown function (DUF5636)
MTIFSSYTEARKSLKDNKWAYMEAQKGEAPVIKPLGDLNGYLDDFAHIAAFLCNPGAFQAALVNVSALIWAQYVGLDPTLRNRFTRALGAVAVNNGFTFQQRMPLDTTSTAPIGVLLTGNDDQLGHMLRHKLFWKDGMDSRHGEHTHSLQWLAIALGARTGKRAADLYAKAGNLRAPKQFEEQRGARSLTMWEWVADCFPLDMGKSTSKKFMNDETLVSQSARSPQVIMDSLLKGKPQNHPAQFLAQYLFHRYNNRGWLKVDQKGQVKDIQTTGIKAHRAGDRAAHGWDKSPSSPTARLVRDQNSYAAQGNHTTIPMTQIEVKCHGVEGTLSYHYSSPSM